MMKPYRAIIFDFDGVLCHDRFYAHTLLPQHADVYAWIQQNVFGKPALVGDWMRNRITSEDVNKMVAERTGMPYDALQKLFDESIRMMALDGQVRALAERLSVEGIKAAIVTNNMDVFSRITIARHALDTTFGVIVNSADHGLLKGDEDGRLFDIALERLGEDIGRTLLVDDSPRAIGTYAGKGGYTCLYRTAGELASFLEA